MLKLKDVHFRWHKDAPWLLNHLNQTFEPGQFYGLVGPNGSGKSTLLRLLSGAFAPTQGEVLLEGDPITTWSPQQLARKRAMLSQKSALQFPFTAKEVVTFGLYSQQLDATHDNTPAHAFSMTPDEAMQQTQVEALAQRTYNTLSGGEACRVDIARVLAQQTPILLLDEPTNHLDPRHQVAVLALCQTLANKGALVIAALHDLNLAARHCHHMLLLHRGEIAASGPPSDVLSPRRLTDVYQIEFEVIREYKGCPFVMPLASLPGY